MAQRTAAVMNSYADQLAPEAQLFLTNFERGINASISLVNLLKGSADVAEKETLKRSLQEMNDGMASGLESFKGLLESVQVLPRLEKEFNRSRRRVEEAVGDLIAKVEVAHRLSTELLQQVSQL